MRKYGILRLSDAVLRAGWEAVGMRILRLLGRRPDRGYGWLEALLSPSGDYWFRYARVIAAVDEVAPAHKVRLIEVASGGSGGMAWALGRQDFGVCLVDRSADLLADARGRGALRVCADAGRLPFQNNAFDVAVSLDTLEHLPHGARPMLIGELKRVARLGVVVSCPLESADGLFQAREADLCLSEAIAKRDGVQPGWLQDHLKHGHPRREELLELLPGVQVSGSVNCKAWLRFAILYRRPLMWLFSGVAYLRLLRETDDEPPYREGLMVWWKQPEA